MKLDKLRSFSKGLLWIFLLTNLSKILFGLNRLFVPSSVLINRLFFLFEENFGFRFWAQDKFDKRSPNLLGLNSLKFLRFLWVKVDRFGLGIKAARLSFRPRCNLLPKRRFLLCTFGNQKTAPVLCNTGLLYRKNFYPKGRSF